MPEIRHKEVCSPCKGTGLYVGMAERDGYAVVCHMCKGTGCFEFVHKFELFKERRKRPGARQVLQVNPGIVVGGSAGYFGGLAIEAWEAGEAFPSGSEMRAYTCPAWWFQSADYDKKPDWYECRSNLGRRFSDCSNFGVRSQCWERFDHERAATNEAAGRGGEP